jgi:hypothetical protein
MLSSGNLRRVPLVKTDVSEACIASFIRMTRIGELGTLAVTSNRSTLRRNMCSVLWLLVTAKVLSSPILTLMMETIRSSKTSVLTRVTRRHIPEDDFLHSHRRENLKSYIALTGWDLLRRTNWVYISQKEAFFIVTAVNT